MSSPVVPEAEEVGFKVFVGNLAFTVDDAALSEFFAAIGPVLMARVIRRGRRSMGYGFVSFETENLAKAAAQSFDKKMLNDREINVELAKPRVEGEARSPRRGGFRGRGRRLGYGYSSGGYRGGFRGGRGGRRGRGRLSVPRPDQTPSSTGLFVANLPYSTTDDSLAALFSKFKVKDAHIVTLRNGRSKGYGFVEFESENEQKKALAEMSNAVVGDRPLSVKVALNPPVGQEVTAAA